MTIRELIPVLDARVLCGDDKLDQEVKTACGSDLMSDVLAFVKDKTVLITGLTNVHVMRTAEMLDIHCVVFARGKVPSEEILEEARRFSYARYDSFENFDCVSLEMLDFENILLSIGSVILYLEKGKAFFFTSKIDIVTALLEECLEGLGERVTLNRVIYSFFELQTKKDDIIFDSIEKEIMDLEQALIATGKRDCVSEIISLRKRLMVLKKYYEQFLNVLDILVENENGIFDGKTLRSFKMLYRRTERRFQNVLNLREYVTQVRESYEAEVDISLNTTMKIFTVVTTIFLPLTLIVGWYGMNLKMPEYGWKYGYLFVGLLSLTCIAGIIIFFKRKKWF